MTPLWLQWLHLAGIAISLGSGLSIVMAVFPAANSIADRTERMTFLAGVVKYFHPLFLFGICLVFMSGAIGLTHLKIGLGTNYFDRVGGVLMWKFGFTLVIFLLASMQCFGLGLKLGRMVNGVIPGDLEQQERYANKIRRVTLWNVVFLAITLYIGLKMSEITAP